MPRLKTSDENVFGGNWSLKKLDCVSAYLSKYLDVFSHQSWSDLWYIDAFCGSGLQGIKTNPSIFNEEDSTVNFVEGSAIRALRIASENDLAQKKSFDHFVFIEYDSRKLQELEANVQEAFPDQIDKCSFIQGDVNEKLPGCLNAIDWRKGRAVSFLDPCSTQVKWSTMEAFEGTCADVWCLFPIEAIMRMLPKEHIPNDSWSKRLDIVFGDQTWRSLYFQPYINQPTLFGEVDERFAREEGINEVISYVVERYKTIFPGVADPGILKGPKNNPLFALFALISNSSEKALNVAMRITDHLIKDING